MNKTKPLREDSRTQLLWDSTHSGGRWRNSWSASRNSRWTIESRTSFRFLWDGLIEVAADFESLEVVSAIPAESIGFSPDALLAYVEGFACRLVPIEVRRAPTPTACGWNPAICSSRIRFPGKPLCAVPSQTDAPPHLPLNFAELLAKLEAVLDKPRSSRSLEEEFEVDPGVAATKMEYTKAPIGGGSRGGEGLQRLGNHAHVQRTLRTREECLGIITATHEKRVRKDLLALLRERWSRQPPLLQHCGHFRTLRGVIVVVAEPPSEKSIGEFERQCAMLYQICGILEYAAKDKSRGSSVRPRPDVHMPPVEVSAVVAWHREAKNGNLSEDDHDNNLQKQTRAAAKPAVHAEQQGQGSKGAKAQNGEGRDPRQIRAGSPCSLY